jgi:5-methylcytosine-specific restriction protein B
MLTNVVWENSVARIVRFFPDPTEGSATHTEVECGWRTVESPSGRVLQLDTYGSDTRQFKGKKSQSIQIDERAAAELLRLLRSTFPTLL